MSDPEVVNNISFNVNGDNGKMGNTFNQTNNAGGMGTQGQQGDNTQNNTFQGDVTVNAQIAVKELMDELSTNAPGLPEDFEPTQEILPPIDATSVDPIAPEAFEAPTEDANYDNFEDHPEVLMTSFNAIADSEEPVSQEEQKSLFSRFASCVKKYATTDTAVKAASLALSGIEATASVAPPWNIVAAVLKTGVKLMSKPEE